MSARRALVTGAAGGIGGAVVARLLADGYAITGTDRPGTTPRSDCDWVAAELTDPDAIALLNGPARGGFDVVVHAAAASVDGGVLDTPPADFARLYDINTLGAVRLIQAFAPAMRGAGRGCFVLLSSINARFATPGLAAYAMSKAALDSLVRCAAEELAGDGIRVVGVAPASIDTPLLIAKFEAAPVPQAARAANVRRHPLARIGTPAEVAALVAFMASDAAAFITGSVHLVDGGAAVTRR